jgi:hypothetical protein
VKEDGRKFHDIQWETGETKEWLGSLFEIAGLGTLLGDGRIPPVLGKELVWALEHIKKYPEPEDKERKDGIGAFEPRDIGQSAVDADWILVEKDRKDLLAFI